MNRILSAKQIMEVKNIKSLSIFWGLLLLFLLVSLVLTMTVDGYRTMYMNNLAIYIYLAISSHIIIRKQFNYCIHFGLTRGEFIKASIISRIQNVFIMVLINLFILIGIKALIMAFSIDHFSIFSWDLIFTNYSFIFTNIWIDVCIGVLVSSAAMLSGALYYKWGLFGSISVIVVVLLSVALPFIRNWLVEFTVNIYSQQALLSLGWLLLVSVILWVGIYLLLNKEDLKKE